MKAMKDFLNKLELFGRSSNYISSTRAILSDFMRSCKGKNKAEFDVLIDATEDNIKKWIKDMTERGLSEKTRVNYVSRLNMFFAFLTESSEYNLKSNALSGITKQLPTQSKQTQRPTKSLEEISKMIRNIFHVRDRAMVVLLAKTGIRAGEISALDLEDVDFENRALKVNKRIGNYFDLTIASGRKNKVDSIIPLDDETVRALKVYLAIRQSCKTNSLFISNNGNRMFPGDIDKIVKNWAIKTGICKQSNKIEEKITPQFFRVWITFQLQINGCNPIVIAAIRGDKASNKRTFCTNQVSSFEEIRWEYERTVPRFGI